MGSFLLLLVCSLLRGVEGSIGQLLLQVLGGVCPQKSQDEPPHSSLFPSLYPHFSPDFAPSAA